MLLSDELHFAFVHVPKCGGTSLHELSRDIAGIGNPLVQMRATISSDTDPCHVRFNCLLDDPPRLPDRMGACREAPRSRPRRVFQC